MHDNLLYFMTSRIPRHITRLYRRGEFSKAIVLLRRLLASNGRLNDEYKTRILYEIERLKRIRLDFRYTRSDALKMLSEEIRDFKPSEFDEWMRRGCIDYRVIDGEILFFERFIDNLFKLCPDLRERRVKPEDARRREAREKLFKHIEAVSTGSDGYKMPVRNRIKMTIKVKPNVVPEGEVIRCWIPFPRICPLQPEVKLLSTDPASYILAPEDHLQRTIYMERESRSGEPTTFTVEYEYTVRAFYRRINPDEVEEYDEGSDVYRRYTAEKPPHISFTRRLEELAWKIVDGERNPYLKALKIMKWIIGNVRYAFAFEYSTYENISEYVAEHKRGDCGMQALLFITLCRIVGVPARWQSGWYAHPDRPSLHDWAQFYVEPYGWLYADPSFANSITKERGKLGLFYFGNIDHYRLVFNNDISIQFYPEKKFFRSEPVDSQRGELEWRGGNLYYDKWKYKLELVRVKNG